MMMIIMKMLEGGFLSWCRPNEGTLQLHVDLSPMAAPGLDASRSAGEESTSEVQSMLEKSIRNIRAVDLETLCVVAGRQVKQLSKPYPTSMIYPNGKSLEEQAIASIVQSCKPCLQNDSGHLSTLHLSVQASEVYLTLDAAVLLPATAIQADSWMSSGVEAEGRYQGSGRSW